MAQILLIDDEADLLRALTMILKSKAHEVTALADAVAATRIIQNGKFDLIISDIRMQPMDGLQLLDFLHQNQIKTPVIMLTAYATLDVALQAIKKGAFDFITKPFKPDALLEIIKQVMEQPVISGADISLDESVHNQWVWNGVVARSHQMQDVCNSLRQIAPTNENVLLAGEEGTGKRFFAGVIHALSSRAKMPFQSLDCSSLKCELYSALSGSQPAAAALFKKNAGGTMLLENIDALPLPLAKKLADILKKKHVVRASGQPLEIDARILATCRKINESTGWMQLLAAFMVSLPSLRERVQDILPLISCLLQKRSAESAKKGLWMISADAYNILAKYLWPRNIDELYEVLNAAIANAKERKLTVNDFPSIRTGEKAGAAPAVPQSIQAEELRGKSFRDYVRRKQIEIKER